MRIFSGLPKASEITNPVLTTGTFDGVHLGHRKILDQIKQRAQQINGESVLFTFYPHPRMVVFPDDNDLKLLNTQEEKIALLKAAGVDNLIVYPFTKDFSRIPATDYVRDILAGSIGVKEMIVGYDHRFGKNREGDFNTLVEYGEIHKFAVSEISALDIDNMNVSSTKVRKALLAADIDTANKYLGYEYMLSGTVEKGNAIGREIGFPTANLSINDSYKLIPGNAVYAVRAIIGGQSYLGMANIGMRPTVDNTESTQPKVEVNVFDLNADLYGKVVELRFVQKLREEQKFDSINQLSYQLEQDKKHALHVFQATR